MHGALEVVNTDLAARDSMVIHLVPPHICRLLHAEFGPVRFLNLAQVRTVLPFMVWRESA